MIKSTLQIPVPLLLVLSLTIIPFGESLAIEEIKKLNHLEPMPGPDQRSIGWEWHYIDQKGKKGFMRKTAATETTASYTRSDGCEWTREARGFAPATRWSNCPSTGVAEVEFSGGDIWPLKVGNRFSYNMKGKSSFFNFEWSGDRNCEVVSSVQVKTVSGIHDTFKVVCTERWGTRSWWLSPEAGTAIAYQQITARDKLILQEMTRIVRP